MAEASHPDVRQFLALARLAEGGEPAESGSEFERAWLSGLTLARDASTRDAAIAELNRAIELAANDRELDRAQRTLANLGQLPIPRLEEVRARDAIHAEVLVAVAEAAAGRTDAAVARLRPLVGRDRIAVFQLVEVYRKRGNDAAAADLLAAGGSRFREPRFLLQAAQLMLNAGRFDESRQCLQTCLSLTPPASTFRREARWLAVQLATKLGDAADVTAAAAIAISEGAESPSMRWILAEAHARQRQLEEAWSELRRAPALMPDTEERARLFMQVLMRREPHRLDLLADVLDRFPDSSEVHGVGISLFLAFERTEDAAQVGLESMQGHVARFVERYPNSDVLQTATLDLDDPERLREQLRDMLQQDPDHAHAQWEIAQRAAAGQIPMGFAAHLLGRSHLDLIFNGTGIGFTTIPSAPDALRVEVAVATEHLDTDVVVDVTSLAAIAMTPQMWTRVVATFRSVALPDATAAEVDDWNRQRPASGSLRWDDQLDTWATTHHTPEQVDALRAQRELVATWAAELPVIGAGTLDDLEAWDGTLDGTWITAVATARSRKRALLCDDVALVALARSIGVPAFGSYALSIALAQQGRMRRDEFDDYRKALFRAQAHDLPLTPDELVDMAQASGWPIAPTLLPLTRPGLWRRYTQANYAAFRRIIEGLGSDTDSASLTLHAASLGCARAATVPPSKLIGFLFVGTIQQIRAEPADAAALISAIRSAFLEQRLDDPLDDCVRAVLDVIGASHGPPAAARFATTIFSELPPDDRTRATALVLGLQP